MIASLVFGLGSTLMAVATGKITLLVGRIFVGIGVGFASSVVPLYLGKWVMLPIINFIFELI